jgi:DNA-binding MarR family transcriptional regulator
MDNQNNPLRDLKEVFMRDDLLEISARGTITIPAWLFEKESKLTPRDAWLFFVILSKTNPNSIFVEERSSTLAESAGLDKKTVLNSLKSLHNLNLISYRKKETNHESEIIVHLPNEWFKTREDLLGDKE